MLMLFILTGCSGTASVKETPFSLAILHINDHHSNLAPKQQTTLKLAGENTQVETGGFPRVVSQFQALAEKYPQHLKLHAGDAITGDIYYSLFKGEADARFMNLVCFDAFVLGNHEFDDSDSQLARFLARLKESDCQTSVLSANVVPAVGTPLAPSQTTEYFTPYVIKQVGTEKIAIIGLTITDKTRKSSQPLESTQFLNETETAARYIKALKRQGIGKIILLTHQGYHNDLLMAQQLPEVDVIVGGDSHSLLGNFTDVGLIAEGDYPSVTRNADGDLVCVVQAKDYSQIVGELLVEFKGDHVDTCQGKPHFLVGKNFNRNGEALTGTALSEVLNFVETSEVLTLVEPEAEANALLEHYNQDPLLLSPPQIAVLPERLCRVLPGKLRESSCGDSMQSDLHHLVATALLRQSKQADIALQNYGGVRTDLPAGSLSVIQVYQLLPFSNTLVNMTMTGAEIKQVLEDALTYSLSPGGSPGAYPIGAGIQFDVNTLAPENQRISHIEIWQQEQWQPLLDAKYYIVVTNSFIAKGLDGWDTFRKVNQDGRAEDTYINYAQAFIDFAQKQSVLTRPALHSHSTRSIILP